MLKKGAIQLSVNAIIILILAIAILGLGLGFITGMFGKTAAKFDELISQEPEPPKADASNPVTLSRESITSKPKNSEVIKVDIFNPTSEDWVFRDAVEISIGLCGVQGDSICYIDPVDTSGKCRTKDNDIDCKDENGAYYTCNADSELGEGKGCVIVAGTNRGDWLCPAGGSDCRCDIDATIGNDPDCDPTDGVRLNIECSEGLKLETITNPKEIKSGKSTQFTALLNIDKKTEEGSYLCRVSVEGFIEGSEEYMRALIIKVD